MHDHQQPERTDSLRPKAARIEGEAGNRRGAAAAAQRIDALDAEDVLGLQRSAGNAAVTDMLEDAEPSPVHDVINSGGRPLDPDVRQDMEGRMGHDFSDVRVHDDSAAAASATAVNANAYTVGSNIVFQRDHYDPSSTEGRTTLAHELTHVVQQRSGPVDGTPAGGGISVSDPSDRFEREASANAEAVVAHSATTVRSTPETAGMVQRQVEGEEEEEEVPVQAAHDESLDPMQLEEETEPGQG